MLLSIPIKSSWLIILPSWRSYKIPVELLFPGLMDSEVKLRISASKPLLQNLNSTFANINCNFIELYHSMISYISEDFHFDEMEYYWEQCEESNCRPAQNWEQYTFDQNIFWSKVRFRALTFDRSKLRGNTYVNLIQYILWVTNISMYSCARQWIEEWVNLYNNDKYRFVSYMMYWIFS